MQIGLVFEELIRKFAEISDETAGEHFTPREVIRFMVNLLFIEEGNALAMPKLVRTLYGHHGGYRRHAVGSGRTSGRDQPICAANHVRAGTERRVERDLQG